MRPGPQRGLADGRSRANTNEHSSVFAFDGFFRPRDGWLRQPPAAQPAFATRSARLRCFYEAAGTCQIGSFSFASPSLSTFFESACGRPPHHDDGPAEGELRQPSIRVSSGRSSVGPQHGIRGGQGAISVTALTGGHARTVLLSRLSALPLSSLRSRGGLRRPGVPSRRVESHDHRATSHTESD